MRPLLYFLALSTCAHAAQPFTSADWWTWRDIVHPRINADGSAVVYAETFNLRETDRACANLWTVPTAGGPPRRLTDGPWRDTSPTWSPDASRIAFLSDRGGNTQIWIRSVASSDDRRLTNLDAPPLTVAWSPDGKSLAYTARAPEAPPPTSWASAAILSLLRRPAPRVQLFVLALAGASSRPLPLPNLDVVGEPVWMPDGPLLVSAAPPLDPLHPLEGGEIYMLRLDGTLRQISKHPGPDYAPMPSPDGSRIAWLSREPNPQSYTVAKLNVANPDGSRAKVLAGALDRDVSHPQWSNDSRTVYFLADDHGATHVYAARNDGTARPVTTGAERLSDLSLADNGRATAVRRTSRAPAELITFPVDLTATPVTLAATNATLLSQRDLEATEEIQYSSEGKTIQGWIVKPPGFNAAQKYPLLIDVDDFPRRMCGSEFRLRAQVFAAAGFVVLCANPRGTPGYGEEFGNLIRTRFPGDDFDDLMRGADFLISKNYIDPARLTMVGGLLAAWAIGHTGRFHSAVLRRPIADWLTDVAHSPDGLYRAAAWMGAMPWDDPDQYVKHSPVYFASNFRTPSLVIAGPHDPGAEELFFALQSRKVDSAFLQIDPLLPSHTVLEWDATLAWLRK